MPKASEPSRKILIIDDDPNIRDVVEDYLEEQNFIVVSAGTGEAGLAEAGRVLPDLILLDVELPDIKGTEICRKMRENPKLMHTPIIMFTAHTKESDEVTGFRAGADDYVAKPFKPARLLARIESAISRSQRGLDANALTHLPGNQSILEEIEKRISDASQYSVLYMDLNNFKAFNDRYGFLRGDEAIHLTAKLLTKTFSEWKSSTSFLGHVGGDDFIGIVNEYDVEPLCEKIIAEFNAAIPDLYDPEDKALGEIVSVNRAGNKVKIPLMGLAIVVVTNRLKEFSHPGEVSYIAGDLKKWVKSENRSAYLIDRRTS